MRNLIPTEGTGCASLKQREGEREEGGTEGGSMTEKENMGLRVCEQVRVGENEYVCVCVCVCARAQREGEGRESE